jgi:hypothetical protein
MAMPDEPTSLFGAILAFQSEAPKLQKDALNPHFKSRYLSLEALMEHVLPLLNKHGLVWLTMPEVSEADPVLRYSLIHAESGDCIEGRMPLLLAKRDAQGLGSAITYSRRYALMSVLGLVADEDDDANAASGKSGSTSPISEKQQKLVYARARDLPSTALASILLTASEAPTRTFPDEAAAKAWVEAAVPKFPARHMDALLAGIKRADLRRRNDDPSLSLKLVAAGVEDVSDLDAALASLTAQQLEAL